MSWKVWAAAAAAAYASGREGMSYAEIAETLRLPQSTIRSRLHKGREELRKELEAE